MTLLKAKAKINLFFHILNKRDDNFHEIESLTVFAEDIFDIIEIKSFQKENQKIIQGEFSSELINRSNIIDKALETFDLNKTYTYNLIKNIPIGAGLGGGSSDAAAVIRHLTELNDTSYLAKIGADLPICFYEKPAYCRGIGEILEPIINLPDFFLLLINPRKTLLTKDVFANFSINNCKKTSILPKMFSNINDLTEYLNTKDNSLLEAAAKLMPEITFILDLLKNLEGCALSRMSGSGPTCFGLFSDITLLKNAYNYCLQLYPNYWIKITSI